MNQYLLRVAGTHDPVAQKSKGTQTACTNLPQKASVSQYLHDVRSIDIPETRTRRIELPRYMFTRSDIYVFKNKTILPRTKG